MDRTFRRHHYTARGPELGVPSFSVEGDILAIECVEKVCVAYVQLIRGDSNNGTLHQSVSHVRKRYGQVDGLNHRLSHHTDHAS